MLTIFLLGYLTLGLVAAMRSRDTVQIIIGVVTLAVGLLVCLGAIALPVCLRGAL